jgi:hypothetical protein
MTALTGLRLARPSRTRRSVGENQHERIASTARAPGTPDRAHSTVDEELLKRVVGATDDAIDGVCR